MCDINVGTMADVTDISEKKICFTHKSLIFCPPDGLNLNDGLRFSRRKPQKTNNILVVRKPRGAGMFPVWEEVSC